MSEFMKVLKSLLNGVMIAGVIMFIISLYYLMIKAGIPYQDPPLELQIQYAVNMGIGEALLKTGLITLVIGAVPRVIVGIISRTGKTK
jgi:hypothetical protein